MQKNQNVKWILGLVFLLLISFIMKESAILDPESRATIVEFGRSLAVEITAAILIRLFLG